MKSSKYNFLYNGMLGNNDQVVIYNARTGALAVLEPEYYAQMKQLQEEGIPITNLEFEKQLLECGYFVQDNLDEVQQIKYDMLQSRFNSSIMSLTIAPTMACNFRCIYCFENGQYHNHVMSDQTIEEIVNLIQKRSKQTEKLIITWYGGEPLLAMPQIEAISTPILAICNENGIEYSSSVVTNGYLFTPNIAKKLKELGVNAIQITIDGPKPVHDQRRPLTNGKGTFDVIMKNILATKGILPVNIRINTDYENWGELNEIMHFFKENNLIKDVKVYLGHVTPSNGQYEGSKCMSDEVYSKFNLHFMQENHVQLMNIYPAPKVNYCCADHCNSWVIDPYGDLYKCWIDIGISERKMGSIKDSHISNPNLSLRNEYLLYDPTEDSRCSECKFLPLCMGGCPRNRMENLKICAEYKYNLEDYLAECTKVLLDKEISLKNGASI